MSDKESDPRFNHIKCSTQQLLNVDVGLWDELVWKEDNVVTIKDFLDTPSSALLLIYLDHNKKLSLSQDIPSPKTTPQIMAYFIKNNIVISSKDFQQEIMCGIICNSPLSQYQKLFEKVLYPIFSNPSNNSRWPKEIANDIILHLQDFRKYLIYHVGIAEEKTVLVVSEMAKNIENFDVDEISSDSIDWKLREVLNSITDMLCSWIPIVKEVIGLTSEEILLKVQQGPATEIKFWNERKINLEFIQKQFNDPCISMMIMALEKSNNCHFTLFKALLQDVAEALDEAKEISDSLAQMSDQLQKLETCEFHKLTEELPEAMKTITLSWTNSKYFNRVPSRISVLIQKTCYFLIEKIQIFLNPSELFKRKQSEMMEKVKISIETCNTFLKSYSECQEKHDQDIIVYPWEFPDKRVFNHFENFLGKLNKIYEIFEAYEVYCSVPEYKIMGIQQVPFKMRFDELVATFKENYQIFVESTYNPLDLTCNAFIEDYNVFSLKMDELDYKLGITLAQACMSCVTSEDCFKLMNVVQDLLKRPLINVEFKKLITSLLSNIYIELVAAKENYYNMTLISGSSNQMTYKNLSTASGILQWSLDLQRKLAYPVCSLQKIEDCFINANDAELIHRTYKEMNELLSNFQCQICSQWKEILDTIMKNLEEPLFTIDDKNHLLLNFTPQIMDIAHEIRYIKMIKKETLLPADALKLDETLNKMLHAYSLLACTTRWYNELTDSLMEFEKALIKDEWEKICNDLKQGLDDKWTNFDLPKYSENVYMTTKFIFERVNQAKENVREMQQFIETWNKSPVFTREIPDSLVKFEMFMTPSMRQQIYHAIETSINMYRVMEENLLLFKCDPQSENWKSYVSYLESILEHGLIDSIKCSLQYLVENTDARNKKLAPFYKINMVLQEDIAFVPSLNKNQLGSLFKLLEAVIENIYSPAFEIRRMTNTNAHYSEEINKNCELIKLKNKIFQHVQLGTDKILYQLTNYKTYADIWLKDIDAVLEDFVRYGPLPEKSEEEEEETVDLEVSLEIKPPTEEEFRTEIAQFEKLLKKVEDIPSEMQVESWLLLDVTSFKDSLSSLIRNWASAYKRKLIEMKSQGKLRKLEEDSDL